MLTFYDFSTGGGSEIIDDGTVSGGEIVFSGLSFGSYSHIRVYMSGITVNGDDRSVAVQFEIGGSFVTSGYVYGGAIRTTGGVVSAFSSGSAAQMHLHSAVAASMVGNGTGESLSGFFDIAHPTGTLNKMLTSNTVYREPSGGSVYAYSGGLLVNTGSVTGFKIFCPDASGALVSGRAFIQAL